MSGMTRRERVLRTMQMQETDRVPVYDIFRSDTVIEHFSQEALNEVDGDRVKALAVGRALDMTSSPEGPRAPELERRPDGLIVQQERWSRWVAHRPFDSLYGLVDWLGGEVQHVRDRRYAGEYRQQVHAEVRRWLGLFAEGSPDGDPTVLAWDSTVGLSELYWYLGTRNFMEFIGERSDLFEEWMWARVHAELRRIEAIADPQLMPVVMVSDDIMTKSGLFFDPGWLQVYWMPHLKRVVDAWHEHKTLVMYRSESNLMPYLKDLVEAGIDGLCPLENMPVDTVRNWYPQLALAGGIDSEQLLAYGMPDEVRKVCRNTIANAGMGYFLGANAAIGWEVQVENLTAMYAASDVPPTRPAAPKRRF